MYVITSAGALIALCDKPRYIKVNEETGLNIEATEEEATGVAVGGVAYNLPGSTAFEGAAQAEIKQDDGGEYVFRNLVKIEEAQTETGEAFNSVENAVCELDAATDERMSAIEDAVCELDEAINGGGEN